MQTEVSIETLLTHLTPVCSGLMCIVLTLLCADTAGNRKEKELRASLLTYYALIALNWSLITVITFFPDRFVYFRIGAVCCTMLSPVVLYRFLFVLVEAGSGRKFPVWHYLFPVALPLVHLAWSLAVPREVFEQTSLYHNSAAPGYEGFFVLVRLIVPMRIAVGFVYTALSIRLYRRYNREMANYLSNLRQDSRYWLRILLILWVGILVIPLFATAVPVKTLVTQLRLTIPAALHFALHILLCFNVIRKNYILAGIPPPEKPGNEKDSGEMRPIGLSAFARHIEHRKPYLNPDLTIIDLATGLNTNRSCLSEFINHTYGMNFSQFINECRLKELDRILADPDYAKHTNVAKIQTAGFGSYRSYRRALKIREKQKTLRL